MRKIDHVRGRGLELAKVFFGEPCSETHVLPNTKPLAKLEKDNTRPLRGSNFKEKEKNHE